MFAVRFKHSENLTLHGPAIVAKKAGKFELLACVTSLSAEWSLTDVKPCYKNLENKALPLSPSL